jgi:hypothetical protein
MRAPWRTLRSSFWMTSLCACGQYQPERRRHPSMMSPTRKIVSASLWQMQIGNEDRAVVSDRFF